MANVKKGAKVADVLIIGAGASGSVAAKHLAEAGFEWCAWSRVRRSTTANSRATSRNGN